MAERTPSESETSRNDLSAISEQIGQCRSSLQRFRTEALAELRHVVEVLEAQQMAPPAARSTVASAWSPEETSPGSTQNSGDWEASGTAMPASGADNSQDRLAELARRLAEKLLKSKAQST